MIIQGGFEASFTAELNQELARTNDFHAVAKGSTIGLINLAQRASEQSPHYDGVSKFGSALLVVAETILEPGEEGPSLSFEISVASNGSREYRDPKSCAEMTEDERTRARYKSTGGRLLALSLAVYGPSNDTRIQEITGTDEYPECPPCHDCLWLLATNPAFESYTSVTAANSRGYTEYLLGYLVNRSAVVPRPASSRELAIV